ncbi:Electron transport complex subunit RsxD [invertebrate metagenome]|uniref:Electron transport complex subunit RsxD n=1 Tax=invertebrate metagenome TaxID=1711999 RepID=A0A2H9TAI4_9ZZZZ
MTLVRQTSPHTLSNNHSATVMRLVLLAALPGVIAQTLCFGWGTVINILWCSTVALCSEALLLGLRRRPVAFYLYDGSALVTALLLAVALPPLVPWWLSALGTVFAIVVGKHLYGGLGQNIFNPAMLGYVLLLISFPVEMTRWAAPYGIAGQETVDSFMQAFSIIFGHVDNIDAFSMATVLDIVRENKTLDMPSLWQANPAFEGVAGKGWFWVNISYLVGGLFLLVRRVFSWHGPVAMLSIILLMSFLFWQGGESGTPGSPLLHLFSGATMLGAFFIITDPVSGATSNRGRLLFGGGVGLLVYIIRAWGGYPDGVAFATLLMNMAAPAIDYYTQPRTYGHKRPNKGLPKAD